jgi:hypothetical protein
MAKGSRRVQYWPCILAALGISMLSPSAVLSQSTNPNVIDAKPQINVEDKDDIHKPDSKIWVMEFKFESPRLITVDIPGRGRKICWYMIYWVINNTPEAHTFIPDFELVTLDKPGVYHDQVLPKVEEAIRQVEDPLGTRDMKNSVTIAAKPIPPSKPNATPRAVTGVAIWDDVNADSNRYSVFVSGLSNGWSLAEIPPDNKQIIRRKTLQLNFQRLGDRYNQRSGEIHFVKPVEWVYRATGVTVPGTSPKAEPAPKQAAGAATTPQR